MENKFQNFDSLSLSDAEMSLVNGGEGILGDIGGWIVDGIKAVNEIGKNLGRQIGEAIWN